MINWLEDATWKAKFDQKFKGRRAEIWHFEGYEELPCASFHWVVKDKYCTLGFGEEKTRRAAVKRVVDLIRKLGWDRAVALCSRDEREAVTI